MVGGLVQGFGFRDFSPSGIWERPMKTERGLCSQFLGEIDWVLWGWPETIPYFLDIGKH